MELIRGHQVPIVFARMERAIRSRWRRGETTRQMLTDLRRAFPKHTDDELSGSIDATIVHPLFRAIDECLLPDVIRLIGGTPVVNPDATAALERLLAATSPSNTLLRGRVRRDRLARVRAYLDRLLAEDAALSAYSASLADQHTVRR